MILDLIVLGLVALFSVVGAFDGALAQGARLLAAVAAGLLGRQAGEQLTPALSAATGLPAAIASPGAVAISASCSTCSSISWGGGSRAG